MLSFQFVLSDKFDEMVVMSGDVGCCAGFVDDRVGSFLFNMVWSEFCSKFWMISPVIGDGRVPQ